MKMHKTTLLIALACLGVSCNQPSGKSSAGNSNAVEQTDLRLSWIPSVSCAGDFLGKERFAQKNGLDLKIVTGGPGIDPIKMIASGANTFGQAGADLVLIANDKGADLVIIGLLNYNSPGVWLAKKESNITKISDIKGKRIGEFSGSDMIYLYEVFLKKTGLVRSKDFTPVPIPFDFKNFMVKDECDLRPVFIYNEPSDMEIAGKPYTLIEPKNFGIQFKGLCYFCKRETVEKHPELVQHFINTIASGWSEAIAHPEEGVEAIKKADNTINAKKEMLAMHNAGEYFSGYDHKVLNTDKQSWQVMINDLKSLGYLKQQPDLNRVLDMTFVNNFYKRAK